MVIPRQYPYEIKIVRKGKPEFDGEGNPIPRSGETVVYQGPGRVEVARQNAFVVGVNGEQIYYAATVYMPLPKLLIQEGDKVSTRMRGGELSETEVKAVDRGSQSNNRIWV